ncbi:MAG: hypothetical protein P1Q69_02300, partial [Candidatus Thorarchaeota archaeon]|nr:hypothetical protein [Candidatus Thorarchaeota archaeon]
MSTKKLFWLAAFFLFLVVISNAPIEGDVKQVAPIDEFAEEEITTLSVYEEHGPISITSDTDFDSQAASEEWDGTGAPGDPYVIGGLNITYDGVCITISDTTRHFRIEDCYLSSPNSRNGYGIDINYVVNGTISNCKIIYKSSGISLYHVEDFLIEGGFH